MGAGTGIDGLLEGENCNLGDMKGASVEVLVMISLNTFPQLFQQSLGLRNLCVSSLPSSRLLSTKTLKKLFLRNSEQELSALESFK